MNDKGEGKMHCMHRKGDEEDPTFAMCLHSLGIIPTNTLDNLFRERFLPFRPEDHFERVARTQTWFWQHKHPQVGQLANCCSDNPISFHNYKFTVAEFFRQLSDLYNIPEGVNGKKFEIPNKPSPFLHDLLPFKADPYMNIPEPPRGQIIWKGHSVGMGCFQCDILIQTIFKTIFSSMIFFDVNLFCLMLLFCGVANIQAF
ncbi:hypothetical protein RFI_12959 [Reticulomyxa filosa]|uniref:Uncharacterized protein n=1 Tax=Reticulomyxa filosa TaxID=46433 RepID=X6NFT5_RETFI|nr:hypothetical protein RFI_12959 [Reticulomyxa filosa]|eukprot:ETO24202.1 hypothetical protein RFI_12959 [Reticulomyxa filosa]